MATLEVQELLFTSGWCQLSLHKDAKDAVVLEPCRTLDRMYFYHPTDCSKVTFFVQFPLHQNLLPQSAEQLLLWKLETAFQHCADPVDSDGSYCLA